MKTAPTTAKHEWYATKVFTFAGKTFKVGDPFPWKQLGCTERRLDQLVSGRRLGRFEDLPKATPKKEPVAASAGREPKSE